MTDLEKMVYSAIVKKTMNEELFTAYDITTALRAENPNTIVRHWEVKAAVHGLFSMGMFAAKYVYTIVLLKNSGDSARVYHVDGVDVLTYPLADRVVFNDNSQAVDGLPVAIVTAVQADDDDDDDDDEPEYYVRHIMDDGRVNIPKDLCDKVKADDGSVSVCINNCNITLKPNSDGRYRATFFKRGVGGEVKISTDPSEVFLEIEIQK